MSHVTVTMSLPGVDVAATERGGPGGDGSIEGVGVGDTLQGRKPHSSLTPLCAKSTGVSQREHGRGTERGIERALDGAAVTDGDGDAEDVAVLDGGDDSEGAAVLEGDDDDDDDDEAVERQIDESDCGSRMQLGG
jgi:hypothetical protein